MSTISTGYDTEFKCPQAKPEDLIGLTELSSKELLSLIQEVGNDELIFLLKRAVVDKRKERKVIADLAREFISTCTYGEVPATAQIINLIEKAKKL